MELLSRLVAIAIALKTIVTLLKGFARIQVNWCLLYVNKSEYIIYYTSDTRICPVAWSNGYDFSFTKLNVSREGSEFDPPRD